MAGNTCMGGNSLDATRLLPSQPMSGARARMRLTVAAAPAGDQVDFAWNPEFPGEAFAVKNTSRLGRDGFGVTSDWADGLLRQVYYLPLAAGEPAERVSVVIPARNEARNLPHVLGALPAGLHEVILVDGHSVDDTIKVTRQVRPDVTIVQQTRRG